MASEKEKIEILILTEDSYGVPFWEKITKILKNYSLIPKHVKITVKRQDFPCNSKTTKIAKTFVSVSEKNFCFLIFDGDGQKNHKESIEKEKFNILALEKRKRVHILVFETEIEELIIHSKKGRFKPSEYLKTHRNYDKKDLTRYAEKIRLEDLKNHYLIQEFIQKINEYLVN